MDSDAATPLPLAGIRVLEFCHTIMGPSAGLILADLGADVIKIEPADGAIRPAASSVSPPASSPHSTATSAEPTIMSDLPKAVHITEEGPREGFQIEKGPIATVRKIALIDALSQTGL
ncbi:MAG TPA: CoA transferase, partial [Xanthobacteraceae bacterium]|nr:CoA transferase [Xanthobacteraceae bacterium]